MQRIALCSMLLLAAHEANAAGVVRIANGDCAGLSKAASAPAGQEPALIVLATKGSYACPQALPVTGNINVDGAGASLALLGNYVSSGTPSPPEILVAPGARLMLRNVTLGFPPSPASAKAGTKKNANIASPDFCCAVTGRAIVNNGDLILDSVSIAGNHWATAPNVIFNGFFYNSGTLTLLNVSVVGNAYSGNDPALLTNAGHATISHSTFVSTPMGYATGLLANVDGGTMTAANSVFVNNGYGPGPICADGSGPVGSSGGNISGDNSCAFNAANDRVVADAVLGAFDTHGGVTGSIALSYNSPAIGNGLAANCAATDARGAARGTTRCDSGAYEFGGGLGQLGVSGTSGLYFNSANNGHYVTVQRVFDDNALVIWNTFDQAGKPAWVYGVGSINGGKIHVEQVAENLGGVLHPGGAVSGVTPTFWGTLDLDFSSCSAATLNYHSALPKFGNGTVNLERLAFVTGLDCSP